MGRAPAIAAQCSECSAFILRKCSHGSLLVYSNDFKQLPIKDCYCRSGACGTKLGSYCINGNGHVAGHDGDTFAYCANPILGLLHSDSQYTYYKFPVDNGVKMTTGKVAETCEEAHLKAVCPGPKLCQYNDESNCVITPLSTDCHHPM